MHRTFDSNSGSYDYLPKQVVCEISLEEPMSLDSEYSSTSQNSHQDNVPDFANATWQELQQMAAMSDHDKFIFQN